MSTFLKLIRLPNLVIIALTQYAIRYGLMYPLLLSSDIQLQMSQTHFFLLVLSSVLIAAGGYIINDYFDTKIDLVNKPEHIIIGRSVSRKNALILYFAITFLGLLPGIYVAMQIGSIWLFSIQVISAILLWHYSKYTKRMLLAGNITIALLSATIPLIPGLYELILIDNNSAIIINNLQVLKGHQIPSIISHFNTGWSYVFFWVFGYSVFAFLLTLIREIVKDMEDIEGDMLQLCTTFPIVYGLKKSILLSLLLVFVCMSILGFVQFYQIYTKDYISFLYFAVFIQLPLLLLVYKLSYSRVKSDFHTCSTLIKAIMVFGIMYTAVVFVQNVIFT